MNPIKNKKDLEATINDIRNYAYSYLEKYSSSKQQLKIYLYKKFVNKNQKKLNKKEIFNIIDTVISSLVDKKILNDGLFSDSKAKIFLRKGYSLNKDSYFLNPLIVLKSTLCDWKNIQYYQNELISSINKNQKTKFPIFIQHFIDSPELEQKASILYNKNFKFLKKPILKNKNKKIRLGYYSADFREHATSHLIARVFELHNKVFLRFHY